MHIRFNNSSRSEDKIKQLPFLCVRRLINILVFFLLQHLYWIERYSTMKTRTYLFLFEYITVEALVLIKNHENCIGKDTICQ